jgi:lysophospholipase L1-like esterase
LARGNSWDTAYLNVKVDNAASYCLLADHDGAYALATGLVAGYHTIEVSRRDEGGFSSIQYQGFALDQGQLLAPPARVDRRIEVIGDSITCGYGNEAPTGNTPFTQATENSYLAYGPVAARQLNAESIVIAWSGIGILRDCSGGTANQMPVVYPRTLSKSSTPVWEFTSWVPQVVVVNLGTNDFGTGTPMRADFVKAYKDFIATLRSHYPVAEIFCAVGPMMGGTSLTTVTDYIQVDVVQALASAGDTKIHFIAFPKQDPANGLGADSHPSLKTHQLMADQLAATIKSTLGW